MQCFHINYLILTQRGMHYCPYLEVWGSKTLSLAYSEIRRWNHASILKPIFQFSSVQFTHSAVSNSLWLHGLQNARLPCPSPIPRACSNPHPLSQWCHPTISSSLVPFSSCLQSFPASGSFPMSGLFTSGSQSIGASASASVLPMNIQDWFPLGLIDLISFQSKGLSKSPLQRHSSKASVFRRSAFFIVQLSHPYMTTGKNMALIRQTFVGKVMSLLFNMLSGLVMAFLPRSKHLLISWLQSPSAVIFGAQENKVSHCFHCFPIYLPWSDGTRCHNLSFWMLNFKPTFHSPLSLSSKGSLVLCFLP